MYNSEDNTVEDTGRILQSEKKEKKTLEVTGSQVINSFNTNGSVSKKRSPNNKMTEINNHSLIITLNGNGLNSPIKGTD